MNWSVNFLITVFLTLFLLLNTTLVFSHIVGDGINLTFLPIIRALNVFKLILNKWDLWFNLHIKYLIAAEETEVGR